ncbi:NCS1 family nucleobase:cation symporter-1 [Nocardioides luteus]|uniref:Nitrate reductase n=1 Tax=Nocardioides luteus TaxID=1844 RepID=A0ABQ5SUS8_9ACTN|nr:NCS1 family nucleobase:cation symporter-1 [Nocardioides luteus]MDR7309368.1 NCS1 family nucleobase:cation symporter-1 [Nocardioides luteus]GGR50818.1 nitrate reductase [Nocardioides luteus]GLJ67775.1 nitrate reductase [Nocardioides luteus]
MTAADEVVHDGAVAARAGYHPRLSNEDLDPLREQKWGWYNIFAFWMSDVHSVGGYVTAGALFALGLTGWQVFVCLIAGILLVQLFCNLVAKPSQQTGTPYPVVSRASFGVLGANIPAIIRGAIAIAWYGVQTFLAAGSLTIVILKLIPSLGAYATASHSFLGLSYLGYVSFAILWVAQALVFWRGMESIRRFIDFCGPAVYVAMLALCVYMLYRADWHISFSLSDRELTVGQQVAAMLGAIALVVSYFSGPMLNFGDFARYGKSYRAVKTGNFWGLPVNFVLFSLLTVLTASATVPVFGELITDPVATIERIDTYTAVLLGGLTFVVATVGINIVANFISPAFDFSNVAPQKISWRMGGMIAAGGSVLLTPWNWYANDEAIFWTLGLLGALIGPLFGILIADFYLVRQQKIDVDDLYSLSESGAYHYVSGTNPVAVLALVVAAVFSFASVLVPKLGGVLTWLPEYSWFIGCGVGFVAYYVFAYAADVAGVASRHAAPEEAAGSVG